MVFVDFLKLKCYNKIVFIKRRKAVIALNRVRGVQILCIKMDLCITFFVSGSFSLVSRH